MVRAVTTPAALAAASCSPPPAAHSAATTMHCRAVRCRPAHHNAQSALAGQVVAAMRMTVHVGVQLPTAQRSPPPVAGTALRQPPTPRGCAPLPASSGAGSRPSRWGDCRRPVAPWAGVRASTWPSPSTVASVGRGEARAGPSRFCRLKRVLSWPFPPQAREPRRCADSESGPVGTLLRSLPSLLPPAQPRHSPDASRGAQRRRRTWRLGSGRSSRAVRARCDKDSVPCPWPCPWR